MTRLAVLARGGLSLALILLLLSCALLLVEGASLERCVPTNGMTRAMCEKLIKDGCGQMLAWVGPGCIDSRGRRLRDGGCQSLVDGAYCKWKCRSRCIENDQCLWTNNECRARGCGGVDIFDFALPEPVRSPNGIASIRPGNWSQDGVGMTVPLAQAKLCGAQFHILAPEEPDINQMSVLELRMYFSKPLTFDKEPVITLRLYLAKSISKGRIGDSALSWYTLRYELGESLVLPILGGGSMYALFRFPDWTSYAFSMMVSSNSNGALGLSCPAAFGNTTTVPLELCNRDQNLNHRLYLKLFA